MTNVKAAAIRYEQRLKDLIRRRDNAQKTMRKRPTREAVAEYLDLCSDVDALQSNRTVHINREEA